MEPLAYQHAGVEYAIGRDHALFGDMPGLGKTAESILLGNLLGAGSTLVVCPASLRLNWQREIRAWSVLEGDHGRASTYPVLKSADGISHVHEYVIISYALLANKGILASILAKNWDHVIYDEAHLLKDPGGNTRTKAMWAVQKVAGRITMLSGTIAPNQPDEVYNCVRLLNHEAIDKASLEDFRRQYYDMGEGWITGPVYDVQKGCWVRKRHWGAVRNVPKNMLDLQRRLRKHIMVRRDKAQVLPQLPSVRWTPTPMEATAAIKKALKHPGWAAAEKLWKLDPDAFQTGNIGVDGEIGTARRLLGEAKVPGVVAYIKDLLEGGSEKVVVAAWHRSVLGELAKALEGYGLVYMDGSTSATNKQRAADQFQLDASTRVILGQTQVIGEGWTLTAAQDIVLAEPEWVPGRNQQVVDRIHRIGQKGSYVQAHIPVVPDTLDERVLGVAVRKERHLHLMLDNQDEIVGL
jgi:SWI/SNF-related matrix-associated actin-dependent regulator 1 of chromatin subfamily A